MERPIKIWRALYRVTMSNGSKFMVMRMCQSDGHKTRILEMFDRNLPNTMIGVWADKVQGLCTFDSAIASEYKNETVLLYKNQIAFVEVLDAIPEDEFLVKCNIIHEGLQP